MYALHFLDRHGRVIYIIDSIVSEHQARARLGDIFSQGSFDTCNIRKDGVVIEQKERAYASLAASLR